MSSSKHQRMSFKTAMSLVPDELPDGAFFALAHEMAGLEYGAGFAELATPSRKQRQDRICDKGENIIHLPLLAGSQRHKPFLCVECKRRFRLDSAARQHFIHVHTEGQK